MNFITDALLKTSPFNALFSSILPFTCSAVTGLADVHKALVIASLCNLKKIKALCVTADERQSQVLCNDLCSMGMKAFVYPGRDFIFRNVDGKSHEFEHQRLNILQKMITGDYDVVISCLDNASQFTIPPGNLKELTFSIKSGQTLSLNSCTKTLLSLGYKRFEQIESTGQFAIRGGILDLFMPNEKYPLRIEFFGDEVESINYFDVETQRRTEAASSIILLPATEILVSDSAALAQEIRKKAQRLRSTQSVKAKEILHQEAMQIEEGIIPSNIDKFISIIYNKPASLFDYVPQNALIFICEHAKIKERMRSINFEYEQNLLDYFNNGTLCKGFDIYSVSNNDYLSFIKSHPAVFLDNFPSSNFDVTINKIINFGVKQTSVWNGSVNVLCDDLSSIVSKKSSIVVLAGTEKAAVNVTNELTQKGYGAHFCKYKDTISPGEIAVMPGSLSAGFEFAETEFYLISHSIVNFVPAKKKNKPKNSKEIYSLSELCQGDYVVHATHGIGIFSGIHKLDIKGVIKDYIKINYANEDVLYVPVTQLDLVAKYIGPGDKNVVKISRLGSSDWQKSKARVKKAAKDIAKELIHLYAQRMQAKGHAFPNDNEWQRDFEATFEFEETPDQIRAAREIKNDMERQAPMDRLLCGDVGFGKTEVAFRAAFKCVSDSKQCVMLCPTTILAWQHYQTALRRFEAYPIRIELLSRFKTAKQQKEILQKLIRGEIDFLIGTHRIVQKDVIFRDLGLAIIDEEQRFGVKHKEHIKEICKNVDVLMLSATPIPRTLNMAMTQIRDMSILEEAPQNRHPVQTYVLEHESGIINEAIRRELRRGGQVFYLHNRIETIESKAVKISAQIPEAKIAVGHGQMTERELSEVWRKTLEQEINVLVCTTIIETGIDLPNANTFIIENADAMGLSQLHQLRGRVGRSSRRAYAYLTYNPQKVLSDISQKRLTAIREFTEFGSGFKIALRDLELRGAGNIIGSQQHGHMEDVGYDMYLKLLNEAVIEEKGEKPSADQVDCLVDVAVQAYIPEYYIENLSQRIDTYRRIADIKSEEDSKDVEDELNDRFGKIPESVMGLIEIALIRNKAASCGIYEIKQNDTSILMYISDIKSPYIGQLLNKLKGRTFLNAGSKPYLSLKHPKGMNTLKILNEIFGA